MFLLLLIALSVIGFFIGFHLGGGTIKKPKLGKPSVLEDYTEYENFLNYNGEMQ